MTMAGNAQTDHASPASAWDRRRPELALALLGCVIATWLALYQWRVVPLLWDPLFGSGSERVLDSPIANTLPIPDATLGVVAYLLEAMAVAVGGQDRWRTQPWIVVGFGLIATALALVGLLLVLAQALLVRAWCTLCLTSATISFIMFAAAIPEVAATLHHLKRMRAAGRSFWTTFWGNTASVEHDR